MTRPGLVEPGKHSPLWKLWRNVGNGRDDRFFLEHSEAVLELLDSATPPEQVLVSRSRYGDDPQYWATLAERRPSCRWFLVDDEKLDKVVSVRSTGGVCGLFEPRPVSELELLEQRFLLLAWEVQDPGNLGTLIRSCAAFTQGGALVVGGCRLWSSKVARASVGSLLRVPSLQIDVEAGEPLLRALGAAGFQLYSTVPRGGRPLTRWRPDSKCAVILGNETRGLPERVQKFTEPITIPMSSRVESLNAGVAGAIVCYEWSRLSENRAQDRIS